VSISGRKRKLATLVVFVVFGGCLYTSTTGEPTGQPSLFETRFTCETVSSCTDDAWTTRGCTDETAADVESALVDDCEARVGCACAATCERDNNSKPCGLDLLTATTPNPTRANSPRRRRRRPFRKLRRSRSLLALALLSGGCALDVAPQPVVHLRAFDGQALLSSDVEGARAWEAIGFEVVTEASGLPRCERRWYDADDRACELPITIERSALVLPMLGTQAFANRGTRHVLIDTSVTDELALLVIAAHEVGHIVLDTEQHTEGGVMGGAASTLQHVDYALACSAIGVCHGPF
jgi:hypothetical protein